MEDVHTVVTTKARSKLKWTFLLVGLLTIGCSSDGSLVSLCPNAEDCPESDGGPPPPPTIVDRSDEFFAQDLHTIDIQMEESAWDTLRHEYRSVHKSFGVADCGNRANLKVLNQFD